MWIFIVFAPAQGVTHEIAERGTATGDAVREQAIRGGYGEVRCDDGLSLE